MGRVRRNDYRKYPNYQYMRPYYSIEDMDEYGPMVFLNDEKYYVEVQKDKPGERFRYHPFMKAPDRHLYSTRPRELKFVVGNKFILRGDEINTEIEPDESERILGTIKIPTKYGMMQRTKPMHEIRWKGLWDKNSDKLYAPDQLLPEEEYKRKHKGVFDAQMQRFGDLYEQAKKVMKLNN